MGTYDEALGVLEEAPLIRVAVDEWLGRSRVRLLASPYEGGDAPMNPRAPDQWGDEHELYVLVRRSARTSRLVGTVDGQRGFEPRQALLWDRLAAALETRWPPREGSVFVVGRPCAEPRGETAIRCLWPA